MEMNLDNCPRCGKLFAKNFRDVCPACIKAIDEEYRVCSDYLRQNKGAHIHEVAEATGVSLKQITKFIREGRISLVGYPNMAYACEVCGTPIRESNMCISCRSRLVQEMNASNQQSAKEPEKPPTSAAAAYRIMDRLRERN